MNKHTTGQAGEQAAESFLQKKGYVILARNYQVKTGELDLVVRDGEYIVFVEVKTRKGLEYGYPREAVGHTKQKRIIATAQLYLTRHRLTDSNIRFDVVEVLMQGEQVYVSHLKNAFTE